MVALLSEDAQEALYSLAYTSYRQGMYEQAVALFRTLTVANPRSCKLWMGLGACFQATRSYKQALEAYEKAVMLDSSDPHVHLFAATCLFSDNRSKEGLVALDAAEIVLKKLPLEKGRNLKAHIALMRQAWKKEAKHG